jgi:hypothetical protein
MDIPPFAAMDEAGELDVGLAVPCRMPDGLKGSRQILGALVRVPGTDAAWVDGWHSDEFVAPAPALWEYFEEGGWNNGYTTEVRWLAIASVEDAQTLLRHLEQSWAHP